ncbi:MAG: DNA polymerase IV [Dehalococcoidia bacterium]|nr:DNA polymerase IV [Dehalococcoidia bacterium]
MRHILHADLDAFYASVEQLDNPELRGKPVVVGGSPTTRGVVAAASYEARAFGIRSAMPMHTAMQRCPQAVRVSPRFDRYHEVSGQVMEVFRDITLLIEPLSLDEAFLDVTDRVGPDVSPESIAAGLRRRVAEEIGLTISVGVATSKSVAKIASDMDKPDGLTIVPPGTERDFLAPLPVRKLWGIGPKASERLVAEGIETIGDLARMPEDWFAAWFGKNGAMMRELALGHDDRPVVVSRETKSVSAETTLPQDTGSPDMLNELIARLSQRVAHQLAGADLQGRTVKLKLRLSDYTTFTRQTTLSQPEDSADVISAVASSLLERELHPGRRFRLIGVGVSGFDHHDDDSEYRPVQGRLIGF